MSQMFPLWGEVKMIKTWHYLLLSSSPELLRAELNPEVRGWPTAPRNLSSLGLRESGMCWVPEAWETQITHLLWDPKVSDICVHQVGPWEWTVPRKPPAQTALWPVLAQNVLFTHGAWYIPRGCTLVWPQNLSLRFHSPLPITWTFFKILHFVLLMS